VGFGFAELAFGSDRHCAPQLLASDFSLQAYYLQLSFPRWAELRLFVPRLQNEFSENMLKRFFSPGSHI